ncbi:MAG: hypothetical protein ABI423_10885 [Burkholderiales bacterium]
MRLAVALLLAAVCAAYAPAPAHAQDRGWRGGQKQGLVPSERGRGNREELRRERTESRSERREQRFTPAEREKLRQDLLDANREMKRK